MGSQCLVCVEDLDDIDMGLELCPCNFEVGTSLIILVIKVNGTCLTLTRRGRDRCQRNIFKIPFENVAVCYDFENLKLWTLHHRMDLE